MYRLYEYNYGEHNTISVLYIVYYVLELQENKPPNSPHSASKQYFGYHRHSQTKTSPPPPQHSASLLVSIMSFDSCKLQPDSGKFVQILRFLIACICFIPHIITLALMHLYACACKWQLFTDDSNISCQTSKQVIQCLASASKNEICDY